MIIITDGSGNVINTVPERVYQGSNNANTIYFACPLPSSNEVTISFKLPNGLLSQEHLMTHNNSELDTALNVWTFDLNEDITAYYGKVDLQIVVRNASGIRVATALSSFIVEKGVAPVLPDTPTQTIYNEIIQALSQIREEIDNGEVEARALTPYSDTFPYTLGAMVIDATTRAIYVSLAVDNEGNPLTDTTKWRKIDLTVEIPDASTTTKGIIQIATDQEASAGVNTTKAITPKQLIDNIQSSVDAYTKEEADEKFATNTALGVVSGKVDSLEDDIDTINGNIETLSDGLQTAEQDIQEINTEIDNMSEDISTLETEIADIQDVIPDQANPQNQLADKNFVNSSLNSIAAFYITKNAQGEQFSTKTELDNTTVFYSGGEVRVPTRNDYCVVLADVTKGDVYSGYTEFTTTSQYVGFYVMYNSTSTLVTNENKDNVGIIVGTTIAYLSIPTTRYSYQNGWEFQYIINKTAFTAAQLAALNSGITSERTNQIETNRQNIANLQTSKQDKIDATHKLNADLVDDTTSTNKFVTNLEKIAWSNKSTVSVSATGTATDEVKYITINGVEKKIGGGSIITIRRY